MKEVPLTQGKVALVDEEDFERVIAIHWRAVLCDGRWYVRSTSHGYLHRFLLGIDDSALGDHKNGDGLDCRRSNIRHATEFQNTYNKGRHRNNKSGFKGVWLDNSSGRFRAAIRADGSRFFLGSHETAEAAARAYDEAATRLHGEFARLNFPSAE